MGRIYMFIIFFMSFSNYFCSNPITNDLDSLIVWKKINSPIVINGCYTVPKGTKLIIEPGVEVRLKSYPVIDSTWVENARIRRDTTGMYYFVNSNNLAGWLNIKGDISAKGTRSDPIIFTSTSEGKWGIIMVDNEYSDFSYCEFKNAHRIYFKNEEYHYYESALTVKNGVINIDNCTFKHNKNRNLSIYSLSNVTIFNTRFEEKGVHFNNFIDSNHKIVFANNLFYKARLTFQAAAYISIINNTFVFCNVPVDLNMNTNYKLCNNIFYEWGDYPINRKTASYTLIKNNIYFKQKSRENPNLNGFIWADPSFLNENDLDFRLSSGSPCIDTGDQSIYNDFPLYDLLGNNRVNGTTIDIGCYEK